MRRCMKKPRSLKVKRYAASLIHLNEYLASFLRVTMADKIGVTELNEIILNSIPNSCNHQKDKIAYVPLYLVSDYIHTVDLNTRLCVRWKTLPNV